MYGKDTIVFHSRKAGQCQLIFLYGLKFVFFWEEKPGAIDISCLSNSIIFIIWFFFLSVVLAESCVNDKLGCHTDEIIVHIT